MKVIEESRKATFYGWSPLVANYGHSLYYTRKDQNRMVTNEVKGMEYDPLVTL